MLRSVSIASFVLFALAACDGSTPPATTPGPSPSAVPSAVPSAAPAASSAAPPALSASAAPVTPPPPTPALKYTGAFATPESVLVDEVNDRYLVSNINGKPLDKDNNGTIAELSPDGTVKTPKWIAGGAKGVTLHAPKGSGIVGGVLYVADIDTVRMFDLKSGAPKGEVKIPGATFLNDLAVSPDGAKIYVSDSGLKLGKDGFEGTGTDAVWIVEKGKARALAKSTDLGRPNGLLPEGANVWVVTFGSGELYRLDEKGTKHDAQKLPKGGLDGIVSTGDQILVSSWEGQSIFRGKPGGTFEAWVTQAKAPADIGFDKKRGRVLVPRFHEDVVEVYDLK